MPARVHRVEFGEIETDRAVAADTERKSDEP